MAVFSSTSELQLVMADLWQEIKQNPEVCERLAASNLIVQFRYREPDGLITINCADGNMNIHIGDTEVKPHIEMSMKADIAHDFWLGKVNLPMALMTGKIVSRGPTPKALALLPALKPAYKLYPKVLELRGKSGELAG